MSNETVFYLLNIYTTCSQHYISAIGSLKNKKSNLEIIYNAPFFSLPFFVKSLPHVISLSAKNATPVFDLKIATPNFKLR